MRKSGLTFLQSALNVLDHEKSGLGAADIIRLGRKRGFFPKRSKTPEKTLYAILSRDIKKHGPNSAFKKVARKFALREE